MAGLRTLRIDPERLMADVHELAAIGRHEAGGIHRSAFTPVYRQAAEWVEGRMRDAGLETRVDAVGNLIGRMGPVGGPVVMTGSHIDTVRNGGPLDGSLGVLAGIEIARLLMDSNLIPRVPFEVVAFADEEGAYLSLFGAMALSGTLEPTDLENAVNTAGEKLTDVLSEQGFYPARYRDAAYPAGAIGRYLELHIEQGPVLEDLGVAIGVVDGIVCQRNIDFIFKGASNHAGTTPMDMRRDAFRAAAEFITRAYALLEVAGNANASTRVTFGTCAIRPGYPNVIPRETTVRMDCRDLDETNNTRLAGELATLARDTGTRLNVTVEIVERCYNPAAMMAPGLIASIQACAAELGYSSRIMPSGAGHDAQALALVTEVGMIFVPSQGGLSHHPDEWTDPADLEKGCNVLLQVLLRELF